MTQPPTIGYYWSSGGLGSSSDPCCLYNAIRTRAVHRTHTGRMLHGPNLIRPALIPIVMALSPTSDVSKYLPSAGCFPKSRNYLNVCSLNTLTYPSYYTCFTNLLPLFITQPVISSLHQLLPVLQVYTIHIICTLTFTHFTLCYIIITNITRVKMDSQGTSLPVRKRRRRPVVRTPVIRTPPNAYIIFLTTAVQHMRNTNHSTSEISKSLSLPSLSCRHI